MDKNNLELKEEKNIEYEKRITDPIVGAIGQLGKWQIWICLLIFIMKFPQGWHLLAIVFLAPKAQFKCNETANFTKECPIECDYEDVIYDRSIFESTVTMQFNLICERQYLADLAQTAFMFGILIGNIVFGIWADKCGRRPPLVFAVILQLICGLGTSIVPWLWMFFVLRFLVGIATGGCMLTSFCLIMEIVGPKRREIMGILYQIPFNLGHASLAAFAYFIRDWRWFEFAISIPLVFCISYYWLVPESPRWLLANKRIDEATDILEKAAKRNSRETKIIHSDLEEYLRRKDFGKIVEQKKGTTMDLFRYPNLRLKTICMSVNWFVCGLAFYGVSQYVGNIGGDIFANMAVSGTFAVPGTLVSIPLTRYWGRKKTLILSNTLAGCSMIIIALLPNQEDYQTYKVILSSIGIFSMCISFVDSYVYAGEIYPTVVRNAGIGISSMIARIGAMAAPHVGSMSKYGYFIPPVIFGVFPLIASMFVLFLPETKGHDLPETIEDGENFGKKPSKS